MELIGVVESHLLDPLASSITNVRVSLARLSIDNATGFNVHLKDLFDFGLGGAVKASAELRQKANNLGVRIALDRFIPLDSVTRLWKKYLTIERLDSRQIQLPPHMLPIDLAEIGYEERVFFARLADIMIDTFDPFLQSFSNQLLRIIHAIVISAIAISAIVMSLEVGTLRILVVRIDTRKTKCGFKDCDSGR
jgi:hypothetical protein